MLREEKSAFSLSLFAWQTFAPPFEETSATAKTQLLSLHYSEWSGMQKIFSIPLIGVVKTLEHIQRFMRHTVLCAQNSHYVLLPSLFEFSLD